MALEKEDGGRMIYESFFKYLSGWKAVLRRQSCFNAKDSELGCQPGRNGALNTGMLVRAAGRE